MSTLKYIYGLSGAGFRVPNPSGSSSHVTENGTTQVDLDDVHTQLILAGERDNFVRVASSGSTSVTIVGLTRYGFRITNTSAAKSLVKIGGGAITVDLTNGAVRRVLRRNYGRYAVAAAQNAVTVRGIQAQQNGFDLPGEAIVVLTSDNTNVSNTNTVTIGAKTYTFKTALTEAKATNTVVTSGTPASVRATGTITTSGTGAANNDTVTVGATTYTFKTTLTGAANEVLRTGSEDADLTNLTSAINATSGSGTTYGTGTVANTSASAGSIVSHVLTLTAISYNATVGNAIPLAKTGSVLSVSGALFTGGTNESADVNGQTYTFVEALDAGTANEVLINGQDTSLTNLASAINGTTGAGTTYGTGTVTNAYVTAGSVTSHTITLTAKSVGTAGNAYTLTKTGSHVSVGAGTFSGGVNSIANEVVVGGSADASLTSLSEAINGGANAGTDYSTATTASTDVTASTVTSHAITLTDISSGENYPTVSTTSAHLSFGSFSGGLVTIYRGVSATVDATVSQVYTQLRRSYRSWVEG